MDEACRNFRIGRCRLGDACPRRHSEPPAGDTEPPLSPGAPESPMSVLRPAVL